MIRVSNRYSIMHDSRPSSLAKTRTISLISCTGINFQKASATLDGCVKVWTSRVDSVATETGRLLSGLAGGGEFEASGTCLGS